MRKIPTNKPGIVEARAPGKIILTGEHFVVLGAPSVAMAIDLYAHANVRAARPGNIEVQADIPLHLIGKNTTTTQTIDTETLLEPLRLAASDALRYMGKEDAGVSVELECDIPVGAGLGSSASATVAIIAAVARSQAVALGRKEIFKIAFGPESYLHGKPSGVDQAASAYGGMIRFAKPYSISPLKPNKVPLFLVCDTGIHRSTKGLVGAVVKRSKMEKKAFESHLAEVKQISDAAVRALRRADDEELGSLMNRNQELLVDIGVSHPKLDGLVKEARAHGALGAKLTGAGGGGCIIALCRDVKARTVMAKALKKHGGIPYSVSMDPTGVVALGDGRALK